MILASLAIVALPAQLQDFEIPSRELEWTSLGPENFDPKWLLPKQVDGRFLVPEMQRLAELRYEEGDETRTFGDFVSEAIKIDRGERAAWLQSQSANAPKLMQDWGAALEQLLIDDQLYGTDWKPSKDHPRDGILTADGWKAPSDAAEPWRGLRPRFEQATVLIAADLVTIKQVENDYRTYPNHIGAEYQFINPAQDGNAAGEDEQGAPFRYVRIGFGCDIPWPYSGYVCDLRILNRIDDAGRLVTDIYSPSEDFHYLAGRDVFLPVNDSEGTTVAYLLVRQFGFDIDDVPDRPKHRAEALRSSMGNLKLKAERAFEPQAGGFPSPRKALEQLRVLGTNG